MLQTYHMFVFTVDLPGSDTQTNLQRTGDRHMTSVGGGCAKTSGQKHFVANH
jgi:hypothetical protein